MVENENVIGVNIIERKGRGRPKGTTKDVLEQRKIDESNSRKGNHVAVYPGDRNGQLARAVPDETERSALVAGVLNTALEAYKNPPCKTVEEVCERFNDYFQACTTKGVLPTVEGLALAAGTTVGVLRDWEVGRYSPERGPVVTKAKTLIAEVDAQLVAMGKMPAVPYIFRAKNFYGMTDKTELEVTQPSLELTEEELKQNIRDSIVDIDDFEEV